MLPISVCIITKNEADKMEKFLSKIRPYDWEIVVVDTGSTDGTREIAEKYADIVGDFEWIQDFSAARNYSISLASNEFILVLDCDEYLVNIDVPEILRMIEENPEKMGCLGRINHYEINETDTLYVDYVERLFSKNLFHYKGAIHEQLVPFDEVSYFFYQIPLTVDHYGYLLSDEAMSAKVKRNLDILFMDLEKLKQGEDIDEQYTYFQIAQCYNQTDDYEKAYTYYSKAAAFPLYPSCEYHHMLLIAYGYSMLYTNRYNEAMKLFDYTEQFGMTGDFHCLLGDIYLRNNYPLKALLEFVTATTCERQFTLGATSHIPTFNIGYINELLGEKEAALMHYKRCGDFPMATRKVKELTALLGHD